ncbi:DUF1656 domain-containing protein [Maridesulfovibrio sp.]|uniref:DUF1656 domain-containing protein n=1 Tax=Maridesulfovibrio sp. TaxID=2795000 RepID=UPI002A186EC3|nr:DUF1656 domain-containing protein [Maridesulfovibrio sp.]
MLYPSELNLGGVYFPPLFVAGAFGLFGTYFLTQILNRYRLSRFFASPPLAFFSFVIILALSFDLLIFG